MQLSRDLRVLRRSTTVGLLLLGAFLTVAFFPAVSSGAVSSKLWKVGPDGEGAGETRNPRGVAASPELPGHVYVADQVNQRIDEFDAWGQFVKAWGWDVEPELAKNCPEAAPRQPDAKAG